MGAIQKISRPIAPFFDTSRPFSFDDRENIFNVIFKKLKILRPLRHLRPFRFQK